MTLRCRIGNLFPVKASRFSRPLVLFHSDDWGLAGIRDQEGIRELRYRGLDLGHHPYDYYSLETAEDLRDLFDILREHGDSIGRTPCFVFNFILSNVDFPKVMDSGFTRLHFLPLDQGLPGRWQRPGLMEAYREGIQKEFIYPALHGLTHFSRASVEEILRRRDDRNALLQDLYRANTPLIYPHTPWVGFEYRHRSQEGDDAWLDFSTQRQMIGEGGRVFKRIFGSPPFSACAPGYRANEDTFRGWAEAGIHVVQNGPGCDLAPYMDTNGLLHLFRNVSFEPAIDSRLYDEHYALAKAKEAIQAGRPALVCMHSVNFHSTLNNQKDLTLGRLDRFLTLLEGLYDDLLYVHDFDLWRIIQDGYLNYQGRKIPVPVATQFEPSPALAYCLKNRAEAFLSRKLRPFF
jgi:hypothetical protein